MTSSNKSSHLVYLLEGLKAAGVEKGSRNKVVAEKTGYSEGTVNGILSGNAKITERFIQSVCSGFGINRDFIEGSSASPLAITANNARWYSSEEKEEIHFLHGLLYEPIFLEGTRTLSRFSEAYRYEAVAMLKKLAAKAEKTGDWTPPDK